MPGRHILHIDANAFYASVEMQENPTLRGKRIAICGSKEDRHGIVLTASYPAKRMGVKTGMAIWEAQKCCRDLIIVPPHYREYMRYSGYMREILQDYTDQVDQRPGQAGTGHYRQYRCFRQQSHCKIGQ